MNDDSQLPRRQLDFWNGVSKPKPRETPPPAPSNSAPTSQAAAKSISPTARLYRSQIVLQYIVDAGGATNEQISDALGIIEKSICPITFKLRENGLIVKSGTCLTRSGRPAAILVATPLGKLRAK